MLKLAIFDVDGTLIDSQAFILAAMERAFRAEGLEPLGREAVLGIVGLSLFEAMARLQPGIGEARQRALADAYRASFVALREETGGEAEAPFYPGAREAIDRLDGAGWLLSIATGKARRGLDHMLGAHGLAGRFLSPQTADDAPSKPHPAMVLNILAATGVEAETAVMVGDTEFDIEMARAAGVRAVGVSWGYHRRERLLAAGADCVIDSYADLDAALEGALGRSGAA